MNFQIMNCRSLKTKLNSLAKNFNMNKLHFLMTNDTWFKSRDPQLKEQLQILEDRHEIHCIRKDQKLGKAGLGHGGVALFYDKANCSFKKFPLNALKGRERREYKILTCRGRLRGVKREVVVFSVYLPPEVTGTTHTEIMEALTCLLYTSPSPRD